MSVDVLSNSDALALIHKPYREQLRRVTHFVAERLEARGAMKVFRNGKRVRRFSGVSVKMAQQDFWFYVFGQVSTLQLKPGPLQDIVLEYYVLATFLPEVSELLLEYEWTHQMRTRTARFSESRVMQFIQEFEEYCKKHPLD